MPAPFLLQFCPKLSAQSVEEIDVEFVTRRGLKALILDLDNTLVPWHGREVRPAVTEWVARMQAAGISLCIVSNTHRPSRLKELAQILGVGWVPSGGKPRRRGFLRAMEAMGSSARDTAVIGDQLLTDIWGGNRCGLLTIQVTPLSDREFFGTKYVSRNIEKVLLGLLQRQGVRIRPLREESVEKSERSG